MILKRKYEISQIEKGHPLYLEDISQLEIYVSDDKDNHWLFYIAPKPTEDLAPILSIIDSFDDEILDMLTKVWDVTTK